MADTHERKKKVYADLEKLAKNLPPELGPDLQQKVIKNLKTWKTKEGKAFSILVSRKTGVGKSTLINGILGVAKNEKGPAREGDKLGRCTTEVASYQQEKNGVIVTLWDSPGLQDGTVYQEQYLRHMKEKCSFVDLVLYCIRLTDNRFVRGDDNPDVLAMKKITNTFGHAFWQKAVIVLTYANTLEAFNLDWIGLSDEAKGKAFDKKIKEWRDQIKVILSKDLGIPKKILDDIKIIPAGHERMPDLPGVKFWLSRMWFQCFDSISSIDQRCALLQMNLERFKEVTQTKKEDFDKKAEDQPIVVSESTMVRNIVVGGVSGSVSGGVIGGVIGGVVGGPIGAAIGAGIGVLLGGGSGGAVGRVVAN